MNSTGITLTAYEAAQLRKLMLDAQRATRTNLKATNYCRRALVILNRADRRKTRKPRTNKLLLDPEIINEITNNGTTFN